MSHLAFLVDTAQTSVSSQNFETTIISLEWLKLELSNFIYR